MRAWVAGMIAAGLSATTVRKAYFALNDMLEAAVLDRRLTHNPASRVPLPAERHHEQRFLDALEVTRLADEIRPERFRALVLVAVYGGLRFGELAGLRRKRVNMLHGRLVVAETLVDVAGHLTVGPPKTRNGQRTVPLPRSVMRELESHILEFTEDGPEALVFTAPEGGPLRRGLFRTRYSLPAVQSIGMQGLRFHDLRHTFVSLWVAAGANAKEISVRAGHSSVAFTLDRYGHLYETADDELSERLDLLLSPPTTDQRDAR